jgi:hypothetical protein
MYFGVLVAALAMLPAKYDCTGTPAVIRETLVIDELKTRGFSFDSETAVKIGPYKDVAIVFWMRGTDVVSLRVDHTDGERLACTVLQVHNGNIVDSHLPLAPK